MNRALRAASVGVLLLSPAVLSACSAGQVTQTATQERDKVGAMAQVGDITVRAAEFASPRQGSYEAGDDAELRMAIVNGGEEVDTLVSIDGDGFGDAEIRNAGAATTVGTASGAARGSDEIEIPVDTIVFIDGDEITVTLTDLDEPLTVGQYLDITLTFESAGELTLPVSVANPDEEVERGEAFDFHHEEGGEEEGTEDTARERESGRQSAEDSGGTDETDNE
ncbi:copper chaperone PCu(A)C [Blastococcus haudaquaticus]|uniref:Copper(I)-binding protein n=1 Tax=Blastococcus haudaquaticus TaxID=1938745 RepID=A0A286GZZ9_9ACTN|nr:copper chaperone PCu(A)C [Blastococcus haudaquaticus]SOE00776.1 Copper(I)-binding protein [Blastococcus haudaquaticus]